MVQRELDKSHGRPSESVVGLTIASSTPGRGLSSPGFGCIRSGGSRRIVGGIPRRADSRVRVSAGSLPFCFQGRLSAVEERFASPGPASRPPRNDGVASALRGPAAGLFEGLSLSRIRWLFSYPDVIPLLLGSRLRRRSVAPGGRPGAWRPGRRRSARRVLRVCPAE